MIFLSITGSWTAAVMYDRREKKRIQHKWTKLVEHIAHEPLDERQMPRKLTVYLSAPPADGLVSARDHFREYVQPILVAAALDWDAIEGRREGDVRAGLAERIRALRKKRGEPSAEPLELDVQDILNETRQRAGIRDWDGPGGDIVIGRHTWKEYVRGMHEGWLGPLDPPTSLEDPVVPVTPTPEVTSDTSAQPNPPTTDDGGAYPEASKPEEAEKPKEEENKSNKKKQPPPFNSTADYANSQISPNCPRALGPSTVVPFPHLLGFWNFPIRMYRFLNRRQVADEIGRQTAAAVLATYRPYHAPGESTATFDNEDPPEGSQWEQVGLLRVDESEWHKTARERKEDDERERVWLDEMVIDPRIGERMRRFALDADAEERARRVPSVEGPSWFQSLWPKKEQKPAWEALSEDVE
jgi:import inner membrane translocase subunit TIM54